MWLATLLDRHRFHDARVALTDDRGEVTYAELARRCEGIAARLRELGIRHGDRILVLSRNRSEALECYVALTRAGAVAVPVNHALVADEVQHIVALTSAAGAIGEGELLAHAVDPSQLSFVWDFDGEEYRTAASSGARARAPLGSLDEPAAILCTSATTGLPKGVVLTHRALQYQALTWLATTGEGRDVTYFAAPPVFHSTVTVALAYLAAGGRVVLTHNFNPQRCLALIAAQRITHAYLVPSMIGYLTRAASIADTDLGSLCEVFHGAAPMAPGLRRQAARLLNCGLRDCYGQAEAGGPITVGEPLGASVDTPDPRWRSAGRPLMGFELRVVDADGEAVGPDVTGEVCVRSPAIMRGYWEDEQATGQAIRHGWLHTGDAGKLTGDGELVIVDRITDVIIRGGQNVYPAEVERVLCQHPLVAEAAVVGVADEMLGERPAAYVVAVDPRSFDPDEVLASLHSRMASFRRPVSLTVVDELPRNPAGKVLKRVLRERDAPARPPVPRR